MRISSSRFFVGFSGVLSQQKLQELVREIDPKQVLDEDVEEVSGHTQYV